MRFPDRSVIGHVTIEGAGDFAVVLQRQPVDADSLDAAWDDLDDDRRCVVCDATLDLNDRNPCDDCTGLRGCIDDMCRGSGYCLHKPGAWIP